MSIVAVLVLFAIERQRSRDAASAGTGSVFSANLMLVLGTLFCTVAGYFAVQPMMEAARAGQGAALVRRAARDLGGVLRAERACSCWRSRGA